MLPRDLHANRPSDGGVMDVLRSHAQLPRGRRRENRTDARDHRAAQGAADDLVAFPQLSVDEDRVHGRAQALDDFHLHHRALQGVVGHDPLDAARLADLAEEPKEIGHALARDRRGRTHRNHVVIKRVVFPIQGDVEPDLVQRQPRLADAPLHLLSGRRLLRIERVLDGTICLGLPAEAAVHLVERDDVGHVLRLQHLQRLARRLLDAMHHVNHENGHVAEARAAVAQVVESLVPGSVDDQQSGDVQVEVLRMRAFVQLRRLVQERGALEERRSDLLRDAASLAVLHIRLANLVQQLGLARVDVAHDHRDGAAQAVRTAGSPCRPLRLATALPAGLLDAFGFFLQLALVLHGKALRLQLTTLFLLSSLALLAKLP
mmetsp:Transcript_12973/g.48092  ORF Transcript_12973/g.48092 Transcript_12973/m.48092 type:complete len:375 (-) Transcript_12973:991-2115(-)